MSIKTKTKKQYPRIKFWHHDWYTKSRLKNSIKNIIIKTNLMPTGERLVDIGCGHCPYKSFFTSQGFEYIGCDIDGEPDLLIEPYRKIPLPNNSFDIVASFQVLEHIWDISWYLKECYRLLKPNG